MAGTGDFNADGQPGHPLAASLSGENVIWFMNGPVAPDRHVHAAPRPRRPQLEHGGRRRLQPRRLARRGLAPPVSGQIVVWHLRGENLLGGDFTNPPSLPDTGWRLSAVGDFNRDDRPDLVWRHANSGQIAVWFMDGLNLTGGTLTTPPALTDVRWRLVGPR